MLEPIKEKVLERLKKLQGGKVKNVEPILCRVTGVPFYNTSRYTFEKLKGDPNNIATNLTNYLNGFLRRAREIIEHLVADSSLHQVALANTMKNFGYVFRKALEGLFIDRMEQHEEITAKFMNEEPFRDAVIQHLLKEIYKQIRKKQDQTAGAV